MEITVMLNCLFVGIGGFIGAILRYLISLIPIKNPSTFPINTFVVNMAGALAIGLIALVISKNESIDSRLILLLKVGICGGFTTFSTFSLESAELIKSGSYLTAIIYITASIVASILLVMLPQIISNR